VVEISVTSELIPRAFQVLLEARKRDREEEEARRITVMAQKEADEEKRGNGGGGGGLLTAADFVHAKDVKLAVISFFH
jgi:hypothetical protein